MRDSVAPPAGGEREVMATLRQVSDGIKALMDYGMAPGEEIRFEHDIAYAGDTDEPSPDLVKAMELAGWQYEDLEECFTLGYG